MNVQVSPDKVKPAQAKLGIVDCDIHPSFKNKDALKPFMSKRWWDHYETYGSFTRKVFSTYLPYPRMSPDTARADAWPPNGGAPGSDLDFLRKQLLDQHNIAHGILHPLRIGGYDQRNLEFGAALCSAINDWELADWVDPEPRLKGSIYIPQDYPEAAVKEIEKRAGDPRFVQITTAAFASEPLGHRRYWPIFEAAEAADITIGMHIGGMPGHAITGGGWPSFYFEHHFSNAPIMESVIISLVMEGVFERFPKLRMVFVECDFAWVPAACWRMDKLWARMRDEVPHVKRPPSEIVKTNMWFTTQPIDEPENPEHLRETMEWLGFDRILFATDYPHWDFDDPDHTFKFKMTPQERAAIFRENAMKVYKLDKAA